MHEGDRIALIAPASPFDRNLFDRGVTELRSLGFEPVFDQTIFERDNYLAGRATNRARAFQTAWRDPSVAGIMAVRGGYGSAHLLPLMSLEEIRHRPKVVVGSSDITSLLSFLTVQCGVVGFHGPMVSALAKGTVGYDRLTLLNQLIQPRPYGALELPQIEVLKPGTARGPLFGGTLTQLVASLGTPFRFQPPEGHVLLLDDVGERPYRIDRMLTQLNQAGVLSRAAGVVCAEFPECDDPANGITARSVLASMLSNIDGPVLFGMPTGHTVHPMVTLPLGVEVTVDAVGRGRVIIEEAGVT